MSRRRAYIIVILVCAVPRLVVLLHERGALTGVYPVYSGFEKSWELAWMFVHHGVFGYVPGHASANTQPLYGWFLIPIFWTAGLHWWSVGTAQLVVAVCTSLVVFETWDLAEAREVLPRYAEAFGVPARDVAPTMKPKAWQEWQVEPGSLDKDPFMKRLRAPRTAEDRAFDSDADA